MSKRTPKTATNETGYNYTVFRFEEGSDTPMSVQVVEYRAGRLLRCNAFGCSGHEGRDSFHAYYVRQMGTFAGRQVRLMMVPGTDSYRDAVCGGIAKTWESRKASAVEVPARPNHDPNTDPSVPGRARVLALNGGREPDYTPEAYAETEA